MPTILSLLCHVNHASAGSSYLKHQTFWGDPSHFNRQRRKIILYQAEVAFLYPNALRWQITQKLQNPAEHAALYKLTNTLDHKWLSVSVVSTFLQFGTICTICHMVHVKIYNIICEVSFNLIEKAFSLCDQWAGSFHHHPPPTTPLHV